MEFGSGSQQGTGLPGDSEGFPLFPGACAETGGNREDGESITLRDLATELAYLHSDMGLSRRTEKVIDFKQNPRSIDNDRAGDAGKHTEHRIRSDANYTEAGQ